jgi:hypothetical protein
LNCPHEHAVLSRGRLQAEGGRRLSIRVTKSRPQQDGIQKSPHEWHDHFRTCEQVVPDVIHHVDNPSHSLEVALRSATRGPQWGRTDKRQLNRTTQRREIAPTYDSWAIS